MSNWPLEQYEANGFAVIENFLTNEEADELRLAGLELCRNAPDDDRVTFSGSPLRTKYFLESANKIHYFYDEGALDANGNLLVDKSVALNKVGHALHVLHPTFKRYTFDDRVKNVARKLGFRKPTIPQSMFIYKNRKIGGEVKPHQDATYLHTEPVSITGFWIPTEDATTENGCLRFIKGSHKNGLSHRLIRSPDADSCELIYNRDDTKLTNLSKDLFVACPVAKGSLVLIHGLVIHQSDLNRSERSRFAYTFHVMESDNVTYSPENWLQLPQGERFPELY